MDTAAVISTLLWKDQAIYLLDQRLLPDQVSYVRCGAWEEVAEAIKGMVVRGAPAIGIAAAYGVALAARAGTNPREALVLVEQSILGLGQTRPTARNLFWAIERMKKLVESAPGNALLPELVLGEAEKIHAEDIATNKMIGEHGQAVIPDPARVLTHCNAGALATGGFGTALGVIRAAGLRGKRIEVIAGETRPLLQGARITAWELKEDGIPVTVIPDTAVGFLMSRGEVDVVIVGADRIAANGDTANKIGTYTIAVLAGHHRIPFYVAAPVSTIDISLKTGEEIPIEERGGEEVALCSGVRVVPNGVPTRNPAFDVTPGKLITAIVTERGIIRSPFTEGIVNIGIA